MALSKANLEKKYNCILDRDLGFDGGRMFWTCHDKEMEYLCDGWNLKEIEDKLKAITNKN